jgi:uncharacterized protein YjiS (DUF1127 family)
MMIALETWRAARTARWTVGTVEAARVHIRRWTARRRTVTALAALDNHTLKDIGINRSEILSVVYGGDSERLRRSVHE